MLISYIKQNNAQICVLLYLSTFGFTSFRHSAKDFDGTWKIDILNEKDDVHALIQGMGRWGEKGLDAEGMCRPANRLRQRFFAQGHIEPPFFRSKLIERYLQFGQ